MGFDWDDYINEPPDEVLLADLRRVAKMLNKGSVTRREYTDYGRRSPGMVARRFGSWHAALQKAGLKLARNAVIIKVTNEELIEELIGDVKRVAEILGKDSVSWDEYKAYGSHSPYTLCVHFGSWLSVLDQAGLKRSQIDRDRRKERRSYISGFDLDDYINEPTDEELLADLKRVAKMLNKGSLTRREYTDHGRRSPGMMARRFGSWTLALWKAGLKLVHEQVTNEELIGDVKRVAEILGKDSVSWDEYRAYGSHSPYTLFVRFGSWLTALDKAGLKQSQRGRPKKK
ncbi:MAG: hypothetical protein HYX78_11775 [Armatimonadetes bacterium]|nr:hypothetical protein [Armatimonadota bacterium]